MMHVLIGKEKAAWKAFQSLVTNFLGNNRAANYFGGFLHSHLEFFPPNCGAVSNDHGKKFHHDIVRMENRYQGKWSSSMLADYCWTLARDAPFYEYKKQANQVDTQLG